IRLRGTALRNHAPPASPASTAAWFSGPVRLYRSSRSLPTGGPTAGPLAVPFTEPLADPAAEPIPVTSERAPVHLLERSNIVIVTYSKVSVKTSSVWQLERSKTLSRELCAEPGLSRPGCHSGPRHPKLGLFL